MKLVKLLSRDSNRQARSWYVTYDWGKIWCTTQVQRASLGVLTRIVQDVT